MPTTIEDVLREWLEQRAYLDDCGDWNLRDDRVSNLATHLRANGCVMMATVERAVRLCPDMESQRSIMADIRALTGGDMERITTLEAQYAHKAIQNAALHSQIKQIREALEYVMDVREIKCASPSCAAGYIDDSCAYHRAVRAMGDVQRGKAP